jgi:hypothetical protein
VDILDAIDQAVAGCHECGGSLDGSPSDDFCGDGCQQSWYAGRADELVGYREPWDRPEDFPPGVIPPEAVEDPSPLQLVPMSSAQALRLGEQFAAGLADGIASARPGVTSSLGLLQVSWDPQPPEFRLPRSTGNLAADWLAAQLAFVAATTDEQRAAVRLRVESLTERQQLQNAELARQLEQAFAPMREVVDAIAEAGAVWLRQIGERLRPFFDGLRRAGLVDESPSADPRERALAARRSRNTGPQRRGRAPRTIGRPSTAGRR